MRVTHAALLGCLISFTASSSVATPAVHTLGTAISSSTFISSSAFAISNKGKSGRLKVKSGQQAVQMVKQRYAGKVLKVSSTGPGYQVKVLSSDGQVFYVTVNAKTGAMSR